MTSIIDTDEFELKHEFLCKVPIPSSFWNMKYISIVKILNDYENESVCILSRYIYIKQLQVGSLVSVNLNANEILIISMNELSANMKEQISSSSKTDLGLEISFQDDDTIDNIYQSYNYRNEMIYSYINNIMFDNDWLITGSVPEKNSKIFCKIIEPNKPYMNAVAIQNITLSGSGKSQISCNGR
jgi:hypothetical protein